MRTAPSPDHGRPSLAGALLPLFVMLAAVLAGAIAGELNTDVVVVAMIAAATVASIQAVRAGHRWRDIEHAAGRRLASVLPAILILLAIGMLIGCWILSGTIPLLLKAGIQLVSPRHLALTAFVITAIMSLATGTSWGSAGTLGVALMGTAAALEAPLAITAGAIVSGAYFGDKLSPLSDSTNICAIGARADLYPHIRHLLYTTVPSALVAVLVFAAVGGGPQTTTPAATPPAGAHLVEQIEAVFQPSWLALLPLVVVIGGVVARRPPALVLTASSVVALGLGTTVVGFPLPDALTTAVHGFDTRMIAHLGQAPAQASADFVRLLERGGLMSMAPTLIVVIAAFLLTGALDVVGSLEVIARTLLRVARGTFGLIVATMASGATLIGLTSHGGVTALVIGGLYRDVYRDRGLAPENLSRALEDSVTIVEPLMPWTVSAVFMATTLGVPTASYAPWAVFCYGGPVFSLLLAALHRYTGRGIRPIAALPDATGSTSTRRDGQSAATHGDASGRLESKP